MKKLLPLIVVSSLSISATKYDLNQLLSIAVGEKNSDLFVQLALALPEQERAKPSFKNKLKTIGITEDTFKTKLEAQQKTLGYAGMVAGESQAEIDAKVEARVKEQMTKLNITIPKITSKEQAKEELIKFFGTNEVGGELLQEIYGNNTPQTKIINALQAPTA